MIVGRLTEKAAGGTSPVTQRIEAKEVIPGWAVLAVAADLTQAICHVRYLFPLLFPVVWSQPCA